MVVGEPLDVMAQGVQSARGDDARLAHAAAEELAVSAHLLDHVGVAGHRRADGRAEALREAHRDGVDVGDEGRRRHAQRHRRVPEAGAVQVHAHAVPRARSRRCRGMRSAREHERRPPRRSCSRRRPGSGGRSAGRSRRASARRDRLDVEHAAIAAEQCRLDAGESRDAALLVDDDVRQPRGRRSRRPAASCGADGRSGFPSSRTGRTPPPPCRASRAASASSAMTVGSSPQTSSPTSASAIARRISGVGRVTVSERRSTGRIARHSILTAVPRRAADYPPPVRVREFVAEPEAAEDERIDVGVLFVGGGPAGLAGAIRLGQLLADDPATAERARRGARRRRRQGQGGRRPPALRARSSTRRALRDLLPGDAARAAARLRPGPARVRLPHAPRLRRPPAHAAAVPQQGQLDLLARPARPPPGRAGRGARRDGAARDRRADAARLRTAPSAASSPATRASAARASRSAAYEPGSEIHARATVLVRGHAGAPDRRALAEAFGLRTANPQVWSLGVKEVWRVAAPARPRHPHARLAAARGGRSTARAAAASSTRWATTGSRSAWSSGSTTTTPRSRCTTCSSSSRPTR